MTARVQDKGLDKITGLIVAANAGFRYLQWGTGTGAAKTANSVTTTSTGEARTAGTLAQDTGDVTNDTLKVTGTITATDVRAITELGLYDAAGSGTPATGGNMDAYFDFASVGLTATESIAFTASIKFA